MHLNLSAPCFLALAALLSIVDGHAIVQLEARGHDKITDPECNKLGAVASESAVCSKIGVELIELGGNAADAVRLVLLLLVDPESPDRSYV